MAEINQIFFNNSEIVEILLKHQGIHEGTWSLAFQLGFSAGAFPISPAEATPGGAVLIQQVGLQRTQPIQPGQVSVTSVDAAKVNPAKAVSR
jgi:hypothetical protein